MAPILATASRSAASAAGPASASAESEGARCDHSAARSTCPAWLVGVEGSREGASRCRRRREGGRDHDSAHCQPPGREASRQLRMPLLAPSPDATSGRRAATHAGPHLDQPSSGGEQTCRRGAVLGRRPLKMPAQRLHHVGAAARGGGGGGPRRPCRRGGPPAVSRPMTLGSGCSGAHAHGPGRTLSHAPARRHASMHADAVLSPHPPTTDSSAPALAPEEGQQLQEGLIVGLGRPGVEQQGQAAVGVEVKRPDQHQQVLGLRARASQAILMRSGATAGGASTADPQASRGGARGPASLLSSPHRHPTLPCHSGRCPRRLPQALRPGSPVASPWRFGPAPTPPAEPAWNTHAQLPAPCMARHPTRGLTTRGTDSRDSLPVPAWLSRATNFA